MNQWTMTSLARRRRALTSSFDLTVLCQLRPEDGAGTRWGHGTTTYMAQQRTQQWT